MTSLPVINRTYEAYKILVDINHKLNKRWAFSLGLSIENSILELLDLLVMAKNAPKTMKGSYLIKASASLEVAMIKARLLLEFKLVNETRVFQLQAKLEEIGKMTGGWLKSTYSQ
ncbi:four helix bundle protein [Candidatus Peregrinibacteria bacterium]|nr:four helix bundle protein [Candidatus Peregrinibacteria bacterium]